MNQGKAGSHYDPTFFEYILAGSLSSSRVVCPIVHGWLRPASLLDVGCGMGAWCKTWQDIGVGDVVGVDGDYVELDALLIAPQKFYSHDLAQAFSLSRSFDLVTSLEVAEHVPTEASETFVENLVTHGKVVLFSAAVPGQGGKFHVNQQPLDFWRRLFASHGYRCFDPLRPLIRTDRRVEPWYRYNTLLYVAPEAVQRLPTEVLATEVHPGSAIADVAPWPWRLRNAIIDRLPLPMTNALVELKHRAMVWQARRKGPRNG